MPAGTKKYKFPIFKPLFPSPFPQAVSLSTSFPHVQMPYPSLPSLSRALSARKAKCSRCTKLTVGPTFSCTANISECSLLQPKQTSGILRSLYSSPGDNKPATKEEIENVGRPNCDIERIKPDLFIGQNSQAEVSSHRYHILYGERCRIHAQGHRRPRESPRDI